MTRKNDDNLQRDGDSQSHPQGDTETRIPLVDERAVVHTEVRDERRITVSTGVESTTEWVEAELKHEAVTVERKQVNRMIEEAPEIRVEGATTIVPVVEEVLVVTKQLRLREELWITKTVSKEAVRDSVELRRTTVGVDEEVLRNDDD